MTDFAKLSIDVIELAGTKEHMQMEPPERFTEYDESTHRYFVDGREYVSVTTVLDLAGYISRHAKDEEARKRGSDVHALCAMDDTAKNNGSPTLLDLRKVPIDYRGYLRAWRKYRRDTGFRPELIEYRVDDHSNHYSGRLDRQGFLPTRAPFQVRCAIIDLKTSTTGVVADYVRLQLAAYANALRAGRVFERIAVALRPDGKYNCRIFPPEEFHRDLAEFFQILKKVQVHL